jgi:hypothetical protein
LTPLRPPALGLILTSAHYGCIADSAARVSAEAETPVVQLQPSFAIERSDGERHVFDDCQTLPAGC